MKLLQTRQLSFSRGNKKVCDNLDLQINAGECWGILGKNGAGKSSLLLTLAGLLDNYQGKILLQGEPIQRLSRKKIARALGIMLQDDNWAFPARVDEFILHGRHAFDDSTSDIKVALEQVLQQTDLTDLRHRAVNQLSGGEARRLSLATLLLQSPQIMLLDEPVNHLDLNYQVALLEILKQQSQKHQKAVVMVLHDVNMAWRYCQNILLVWDEGKTEFGPAHEMLNTNKLSRLYGHDIGKIEQNGKTLFYPM